MFKCAELFIQAVREKDLSCDVKEALDGDVIVKVIYENKITTFIFSGADGKYVSMYSAMDTVPADRFANVLLVCNKLNAEYKWLKFYIDSNNFIMVEDDAILTEENATEECFDLLIRRMTILEDVKPSLMGAIYVQS